MKKVLLLTFSLGTLAIAGYSQKNKTWSVTNVNANNVVTDESVKRQGFPVEFKLFELDAPTLKQDLFSIVDKPGNQRTVISIPNADGQLEQFEMVEASNFEPALQARFPEIRSYSGKSLTDPGATIKLSYSPEGVQTMVFRTGTENEFIEPYSEDHTLYAVYRSQRSKGNLPWSCTTEDVKLANDLSNERVVKMKAVGSSSGTLKTLRLAQSVNGEYSNYFGATSSSQVGLVLAAVNATLTRCNGVFEKDLAIHLNLINQTTDVFYYNPGTDPYSTNLSNWNLQLQQTLTSVIGNNNYDIGHMFGKSGGGGNAGCIGCVCVNPANNRSLGKGSGITSPADGIPMGDNFDIDYVAHEMGHQLGANHTFSMSLEGTGQNKEIGSGITIMGYAGITSYDVAPHSIDIFHETSIAQIQANLANKTCPVTTTLSTNTAPTISPVSNYTIPFSTPFALTASATDAQNDPLTYCWEQNDNSTTSGSGSVASPTKTTGPNFLSFLPTTSPTRLFPRLQSILAGSNTTGTFGGDAVATTEALSSVSRTLNFRLTVRDNHPFSSSAPVAVGQTAFTDVVVTVNGNVGPFAVTSPNSNITWTAGGTATVTWSVNGTSGAPINCANVKISMSTDGGQTFPVILASSTPNDGSQSITVPNTPGTTNRIKVEAIGNIFFDISNTNFTISGSAPVCNTPTGLASSNISETGASVSWAAVSGAVSYEVGYAIAGSNNWTTVTSATTATSVNISGLSASTDYDWRVKTNCSSNSSTYSQAQFTTTNASAPCDAPTGLASSNITENSATVSWTAVSGAVSYEVGYAIAGSNSWTTVASASTSTSVNLTGLNASTNYDWRVKTNCSSSSSSYAIGQFTTDVSTAPPCPGEFDVPANNAASTAPTIPVNTDIYGLIEARGDNDYYKFIAPGGTTTITLTNLPADYQLELRNVNGNSVLQSSTNNGPADESITATLAAGTYTIRIYPKNNGQWNANSCYKLNISTGTGRMSAAELIVSNKKMSVSPNPVRSNVNVSFVAEENGNATISLIDQTGATIASKVVPMNAGINNRNLFVGNVANGMYYIKLQTNAGIQMSKILVSK